ncbi:MAG: Kelch repeat type 1-containing protein [Candidatus Collierbacteria bacterium GW2011_GWA2_46_26]|uniref:Kelch repeat type 1-containing protein n=1 Tax=Candidatus Collierbacteria bacterium GW2011_GWA2_46_26 TaxID=1618381 RepID=A0A0G1RV40_9BACT|nr:MAG: Kelch repeat type 1-containing protein [Candidatus Collierbacteria bacterium GW2011_GWC2_44_13]KKU33843.1 MAG: Kelch repeat type 1-containing protein [Candidatus Collierbacteria bacterium GW2011_GWA2_46_26]
MWRDWSNRNVNRNFIGSKLKISGKNIWKKGPDLPTYRYEFGSALVGDNFYIIGGVTAPTVYTVTKRVDRYDIKSKEWSRVSNHPYIIHHPGVTSDQNFVYVIGGNGLRISSYSIAHKYNPETDRWQRLADMPTKRCALGLAYLDGKIYAVGGADNKRPLSAFEEYDVEKNQWKNLPDMPTAREHLFSVTIQRFVYVLGGYQNDRFHNVNTFERYSIGRKVWEKLAPLPAKISGFSACIYGKSIFAFGGEQGWATSDEIYEYKLKEKKWFRRGNMPAARYAGAVISAEDGIHIVGGNPLMMSGKFSNDHDILIPQ